MPPGFQQKTLDVSTGDGLDDVLLEPLEFVRRNGDRLRAPIGSTTDGLSTPKIVRLIPGYDATGDDWFSGVLHDSGYRDFLEVFCKVTQFWSVAHFTQKQCDDLILEAMILQGVGWWRRHTIYVALRCFGFRAFAADRLKSGIRRL